MKTIENFSNVIWKVIAYRKVKKNISKASPSECQCNAVISRKIKKSFSLNSQTKKRSTPRRNQQNSTCARGIPCRLPGREVTAVDTVLAGCGVAARVPRGDVACPAAVPAGARCRSTRQSSRDGSARPRERPSLGSAPATAGLPAASTWTLPG